MRHIKPNTWEERLTLYVRFLIDKKKKSTTIESYISAIKAVLLLDGKELNEDRYLLNSLIKACKFKNDKVTTRLPIRKETLGIILKYTDTVFNKQPYLKVLYRALFSMAYYGLFRIGELTSGTHPVLAKDVHISINKNKMMFVLHSSKMHGKSMKPQVIKINAKKETSRMKHANLQVLIWKFCPFKLL